MNLYHLKYFYDSARYGSITKAAQLNRIGQPAISKGIQSLEGVFGKTLISHQRNRFQLTEEGVRVYSYCEKIFSATDELKDSLTKSTVPAGMVRIACPSTLAQCDFFTDAVKAIHLQYPLITLKLMLGRTDLVRDWVKNGIADFAIVVDNVDVSGFKVDHLRTGSFYLIQSKEGTHRWQEEGILTIEEKREVQELKKKYKAIHHRDLPIKMEIGSWGVIKKFVQSGVAVGFVPDLMIQEDLKAKKLICIEPKKLSVPYTISLIRKSEKYLTVRCRHVIEELMKSAK